MQQNKFCRLRNVKIWKCKLAVRHCWSQHERLTLVSSKSSRLVDGTRTLAAKSAPGMRPGLLVLFLLFRDYHDLWSVCDNLSGAPTSLVAKLKMSWSRKEAFDRTQPWGVEGHRMSQIPFQTQTLRCKSHCDHLLLMSSNGWKIVCCCFPLPDSPRFSAANLIAASNTIHFRVHRNAKIGKKHTPSKTCPWSQKGKPLSPGFHGKQSKASHCIQRLAHEMQGTWCGFLVILMFCSAFPLRILLRFLVYCTSVIPVCQPVCVPQFRAKALTQAARFTPIMQWTRTFRQSATKKSEISRDTKTQKRQDFATFLVPNLCWCLVFFYTGPVLPFAHAVGIP